MEKKTLQGFITPFYSSFFKRDLVKIPIELLPVLLKEFYKSYPKLKHEKKTTIDLQTIYFELLRNHLFPDGFKKVKQNLKDETFLKSISVMNSMTQILIENNMRYMSQDIDLYVSSLLFPILLQFKGDQNDQIVSLFLNGFSSVAWFQTPSGMQQISDVLSKLYSNHFVIFLSSFKKKN